jgi:transcriptional regulator with XRE-family HTH domain
MGAAMRRLERANRQGAWFLRMLGAEFREARIGLGLSQSVVAAGCTMPRVRYCQIEAGTLQTFNIIELARIAAVLGLDASIRLYPGGAPLRDGAQAERLRRLLRVARPPLSARTEVALPSSLGRRELRAWDAVLLGSGERTAIELEMRLRDSQAVERRIALKRRDDPTEHFLLAIADTRTNRHVLAALEHNIAGLTRVGTPRVLAALERGLHPQTGYVLI